MPQEILGVNSMTWLIDALTVFRPLPIAISPRVVSAMLDNVGFDEVQHGSCCELSARCTKIFHHASTDTMHVDFEVDVPMGILVLHSELSERRPPPEEP